MGSSLVVAVLVVVVVVVLVVVVIVEVLGLFVVIWALGRASATRRPNEVSM